MPMKTSSAAASNPTIREVAQGCFTANLMVPGMGSLVAGRKIGYAQLVICLTGLALSLIFGIRFIFWSLAHWSELHDPNAGDPIAALHALLRQACWPLLGILLFAVAWLWALLTSYFLLAAAKQTTPAEKKFP